MLLLCGLLTEAAGGGSLDIQPNPTKTVPSTFEFKLSGDSIFDTRTVYISKYYFETGQDFVTGEKMGNAEYGINGLSMAIDLFPVLKPLKAGRGAVKAAVSGVKRAAKEVGEEVSQKGLVGAGRSLKESAERQARDIGEELMENAANLSAKAALKNALHGMGGKLKTYAVATGIRARSVIPGVGLKNQCLHKVSKRGIRAIAKYIEWEDATRRMLKEADGTFWTDDALETLFKNACFVAGTPVVMADGSLKPIEQVKVGDKVLSRHESGNGPLVAAEVTQTFVRQTDHIRTLKIRINKPQARSRSSHVVGGGGADTPESSSDDGGGDDSEDDLCTIQTTDEHPFWMVNRGWVTAGELAVGDTLSLASGDTALLQTTSRKSHCEGVTVYSFTSQESHTKVLIDRKLNVEAWKKESNRH